MSTLSFFRKNWRWLLSGVVLAFYSVSGQTFFIGLFSAHFMESFELSHAEWGSIYSIASVLSAVILLLTAGLYDAWKIRTAAIISVLLVAAVCVAFFFAQSQWLFFLLIFALRLLGKGGLQNLSAVSMMRWFSASKGRAVAIASLGMSIGEAIVPLLVVSLIMLVGWRETFLVIAGCLCLSLPFFWSLLRTERSPSTITEDNNMAFGLEQRHWTASEVVKSRFFPYFVPLLSSSEFLTALIFFNFATLAEEKGWEINHVAGAFPILTIATFIAAYAYGVLTDRWGVDRYFPTSQLPMVAAFLCLSFGSEIYWLYIAFVFVGIQFAGGDIVQTLILPHFFGNKYVSSLRGLKSFMHIGGGALAPILSGFLLDHGTSATDQYLYAIAWILFSAALAFLGTSFARSEMALF